MTDKEIAKQTYNLIQPLVHKMNNSEDTEMIEYQIDAIVEGLTEEQEQLLDKMFDEVR